MGIAMLYEGQVRIAEHSHCNDKIGSVPGYFWVLSHSKPRSVIDRGTGNYTSSCDSYSWTTRFGWCRNLQSEVGDDLYVSGIEVPRINQ